MTEKVKGIGFTQLTNAEHLNFHLEVKGFIEKCGVENISATEELAKYGEGIEIEVNMVNRQVASALTGDLEAKDKERDELLSYIFATVENAKNAPMESFKEANKQISPVLSPYKGIGAKTNSQESAEIVGLIKDLTKDGVASHMATLNLSEVVTMLGTINDEYMGLDQQRTSETPSKADSRNVRSKVEDVYDHIIDKVNATVVLMPNENASQLVQDLNNLIDKTRASYNRRTAKRGE